MLFILSGCGDTPPEPLPAPEPPPLVAPEPPAPAPIVWETRYAASWIVVAYLGSVNAPAGVTRTRDEARTRAEDVRARAVAGDDFAALASSSSDAPDARRGGALGTWLTGAYDPSVEEAVARAEVGGIGVVADTPWGFAVVKRLPVVQAHAQQIVVAWQGAEPRQVLRSHDEAKARADSALGRLAAGEDFAALARELSDDVSAADGGDVGVVGPGQLVPAVDAALFGLKDGETSGLVEAPYGYVIVRRVSP